MEYNMKQEKGNGRTPASSLKLPVYAAFSYSVRGLKIQYAAGEGEWADACFVDSDEGHVLQDLSWQ
jgi:hypothetical protein